MNWTVVHAITEDSPLAGLTGQDLEQVDAEILVLVRAHDESYAQTVHARASWKAPEIRFAMRYASMMSTAPDGAMELDLSRLGALEPTPQA